MKCEYVCITTNDGNSFTIPFAIAKLSKTLCDCIRTCSHPTDSTNVFIVHIPRFSGIVIGCVLEYCTLFNKHHMQNKTQTAQLAFLLYQKLTNSLDFVYESVWMEWELNFLQRIICNIDANIARFTEILKCAEYLDIERLTQLLCYKYSLILKQVFSNIERVREI